MEEKKKLPIGEEFFRNIRTRGFYYVDKTGFINELLRTRNTWVFHHIFSPIAFFLFK